VPGKNSAVRDHRVRVGLVHKEMDQVDAMAQPLVRNPTGKILVQPELKIKLRIERAIRLVHQPGAPVRSLLADLLYFRTSAPTRPMIVPGNFVFADVSQRAAA